MSLDNWLSPANSKGGGVSKRRKLNDLPKPFPNLTHKAAREIAARSVFSDLPPEYYLGKVSLSGWCSHSWSGSTDTIYSVESLPGSPFFALALGNGDLLQVNSGVFDANCPPQNAFSGHETVTSSTILKGKWPVHSMASTNSNKSLICGSDHGLHTLDVATWSQDASFQLAHDPISTVKVLPDDSNVVSVGTKSGKLALVDIRERDWRKSIAGAHAVVDGPKAQRVNPSISALAWTGPTTLASACQLNESVKFWDTRYMNTKYLLMSTIPRSRSWQKRKGYVLGGINSLVSEYNAASSANHPVWALTRNGEILKLVADSEYPDYRIGVNPLEITSTYEQIEFIPHATRSHSPQYPLIACGGRGRVTLVSVPSTQCDIMRVNATQASQLVRCLDASSIVSSVKWNPYTQKLLTVDSNRWGMWAPNSGLRDLKFSKTKMLSVA